MRTIFIHLLNIFLAVRCIQPSHSSANETRCLCSLPASAAHHFTRRLTRPPSTLLMFDYPSPPVNLSPLRSLRAICLLSCWSSQRSPWLIVIMRCVMKRILADMHSEWCNKHLLLWYQSVKASFRFRLGWAVCVPKGLNSYQWWTI